MQPDGYTVNSSSSERHANLKQIQETLQNLDLEYFHNLLPKEQSLRALLKRIQHEEQSLQNALHEARGTSVQQRQKDHHESEAAATARLEEALFMGSEDDDTSTSTPDLKRTRIDKSYVPSAEGAAEDEDSAASLEASAGDGSNSSAMARLQQALLGADDSSSSDDE